MLGNGVNARSIVRAFVAVAMVGVGILHFTSPEGFTRIVPPWLPEPRLLVDVSGVFEIALGIALVPQRTRRLAGLGLVALYLAVFPANIHMAVHHVQIDESAPIPVWAMWARLPFQFVFIAAALYASGLWPRLKPALAASSDRRAA